MAGKTTTKKLKLKKVKPSKAGGPTMPQQIAEQIRQAIKGGQLSAGDPLPPTRALAEQHGVDRKHFVSAYRLLSEEGLVETIPQVATVVASKSKKKATGKK